jgi:hypothetical protein
VSDNDVFSPGVDKFGCPSRFGNVFEDKGSRWVRDVDGGGRRRGSEPSVIGMRKCDDENAVLAMAIALRGHTDGLHG